MCLRHHGLSAGVPPRLLCGETGSAAVLRQLVGRKREGWGSNPTLLYRLPLLGCKVVLVARWFFTCLVPLWSPRGAGCLQETRERCICSSSWPLSWSATDTFHLVFIPFSSRSYQSPRSPVDPFGTPLLLLVFFTALPLFHLLTSFWAGSIWGLQEEAASLPFPLGNIWFDAGFLFFSAPSWLHPALSLEMTDIREDICEPIKLIS